jgi:hypothetical protein
MLKECKNSDVAQTEVEQAIGGEKRVHTTYFVVMRNPFGKIQTAMENQRQNWHHQPRT